MGRGGGGRRRGRGHRRRGQLGAGQLWVLSSRTAATATAILGDRCSPSRTTRTLCRCVLTPAKGTRTTGRSVLDGVSSGAIVMPHPTAANPTAVPASLTEAASTGSKPAVVHSDTVSRPSVSVGQKIHGSSWSSVELAVPGQHPGGIYSSSETRPNSGSCSWPGWGVGRSPNPLPCDETRGCGAGGEKRLVSRGVAG